MPQKTPSRKVASRPQTETPGEAQPDKDATSAPAPGKAQASRRPKAPPASAPRRSKADDLIALLRRKSGASLEELQHASGWQPHSVRGFLSGTVRKRLGLSLASEIAAGGTRRYRIAGEPRRR